MIKKPIDISSFVSPSNIKPVLQLVQVNNSIHTATDTFTLVTITYKEASGITVPDGFYKKGILVENEEQYPAWQSLTERFNDKEVTSGLSLKYDIARLGKLLAFFGKLVPKNNPSFYTTQNIEENRNKKIMRLILDTADFTATAYLMALSE